MSSPSPARAEVAGGARETQTSHLRDRVVGPRAREASTDRFDRRHSRAMPPTRPRASALGEEDAATSTSGRSDGVDASDDATSTSSGDDATLSSSDAALASEKRSAMSFGDSSESVAREEGDPSNEHDGDEDSDEEEYKDEEGDAGDDEEGDAGDDEEDENEEVEGGEENDDLSTSGRDGNSQCEGEHCMDTLDKEVYKIVEDVAAKTALDTHADVNEILAIATGTGEAPRTMQEEAADERVAAFSMTVMILIVLLTLMLGVMLKHYKSRWLHSSGAALLLGIAVGCFVFLTLEASYESMPETMRYSLRAFAQCMRFDTKFFFLVLLPPLVFEAGYTLHPTTFFNNSDAISTFAFVGSLTSAIATGVLMYSAGLLGLCYKFSLKSSMLFGALISSTDPVTSLSVFSSNPINPDLHAIIVGESIMNDAIIIVLFESLLLGIGASSDASVTELLQQDAAFLPLILQAVGTFLLAFGQATAVGVGIGCFSALLHKYVRTTNDFEEGWVVDSALVLLFPYLSYSLSESFELSGIVAVLFTGIVMGRYTRPNLARAPRMVTMCVFKIFSFLSETFVFVYMGSAMYAFRSEHIITAIVGLLTTYIGRAVNIFPGSFLLNASSARRNTSYAITPKMQILLWFSGLRGAVAFALAVKARRDLGEQGHVMFDVTLFIVAFTIVIQGGMTSWVLEKLNEPTEEKSEPTERLPSSTLFSVIDSVAKKIIEPILTRRSTEDVGETTSLLQGSYAGGREEAAQAPRATAHASELNSETVEAAVDHTFSQRDFS